MFLCSAALLHRHHVPRDGAEWRETPRSLRLSAATLIRTFPDRPLALSRARLATHPSANCRYLMSCISHCAPRARSLREFCGQAKWSNPPSEDTKTAIGESADPFDHVRLDRPTSSVSRPPYLDDLLAETLAGIVFPHIAIGRSARDNRQAKRCCDVQAILPGPFVVLATDFFRQLLNPNDLMVEERSCAVSTRRRHSDTSFERRTNVASHRGLHTHESYPHARFFRRGPLAVSRINPRFQLHGLQRIIHFSLPSAHRLRRI